MYNKGDEAMKIFFKRVVVVLLIVTMFFGGIPNDIVTINKTTTTR